VAAVSAVKLIAAPAAILTAALGLGLTGDPLTVAVVCTASPLATSAYILARQLGGDAALAANLVTASTLLSLATLPVAILLVA
jgi:malonate transporter and related proteins